MESVDEKDKAPLDSCPDEGATKPIIEFEDATGCSQQQSPSSSWEDHCNDVGGKVNGKQAISICQWIIMQTYLLSVTNVQDEGSTAKEWMVIQLLLSPGKVESQLFLFCGCYRKLLSN